MGRKIVLLSDGTGNSAAKVWRTNVWRIFESLDLSNSRQVAFYDDGVGTSSFKPVAILGGAFGYGLKRNVIDIYKFACRNYTRPDDEIFGFGFSRGAFTMRVVMGLIVSQGLVVTNSEQELHTKAKAAYRAFRRERFHTYLRIEKPFRWLRDRIVEAFTGPYSAADNRHDVNIKFLGLWDTVAAYGLPIDEMTRGINQWIWPLQLPDCDLHRSVQRACHALSIDDERTTFHPVLWDESAQKPVPARSDGKRYVADERISQVWFAGVHSNVGGGYPDDSLAHIPLVWMMDQAQASGLQFKPFPDANPETVIHATTVRDTDGRLYDSRQGLGGYYRYGPRHVKLLCEHLICQGNRPKIHESVLKRIRNYAHLYAPKGLPADYDVVTTTGEILTPAQNTYESAAQASARYNFQEQVWDVVWRRRIVYFLTVFVSLYLVIYPLWKALPKAKEFETPLRWLSDIVRLTDSFLPSAAMPWVNAYARSPGRFVATVVVLIILLKWGSRLASTIDDRLQIYWRQSIAGILQNPGQPDSLLYRLRTQPLLVWLYGINKEYVTPFLYAFFFACLGLALLSHVAYVIQDDAGLICKQTGTTKKLGPGESLTVAFDPKSPCQSAGFLVEENAKYLVTLQITEPFFDDEIPASQGFYTLQAPRFKKLVMLAALPLRRELIRPWFRLVARYGGVGGEETFFDPDPNDGSIAERIIATRNGELFFFVNDAVLPIPGHYDYFYRNNKGAAKITIKHLGSCPC